MATSEDSNDALWNQSVCSKSWVELCEEEEAEMAKLQNTNESFVDSKSALLRDSTNTKHTPGSKVPVKEEPILDETACDISITNETKDIKIQPSDALPNFSISHIKSAQPTESVKENSTVQCRKSEPNKEYLHEDLSISSHLNFCQIVSPCKTDNKTPTKTPTKTSITHFLTRNDRKDGTSSPIQGAKRKLQDTETNGTVTDDMLMPSPSKIRKQNPATPSSSRGVGKHSTPSLLNFTPRNYRKRPRESTPGHSSEKKTPREVETDPEVIARRQKQIEYGKNTIGYDRYTQLVPREARQKMHPRTPPLHLKFSRRAWDGLVKVWRQRLHFWDPPSEGGGNPECLEGGGSEMSDASGTEGSLPNTPIQDKKRQCWKRSLKPPAQSDEADDDDDNQGCTPLPPE